MKAFKPCRERRPPAARAVDGNGESLSLCPPTLRLLEEETAILETYGAEDEGAFAVGCQPWVTAKAAVDARTAITSVGAATADKAVIALVACEGIITGATV